MPFSFVKHCLILLALTISVSHANAKESILSPDGQLSVTFSLDEGTHEYSVSAHWERNPASYRISAIEVVGGESLTLKLKPGGGAAIQFIAHTAGAN